MLNIQSLIFTVFTQLGFYNFHSGPLRGNSYERFINDAKWAIFLQLALSPGSYESLLSRVNPVQGLLDGSAVCSKSVGWRKERMTPSLGWEFLDIAGAKILKIKGTF